MRRMLLVRTYVIIASEITYICVEYSSILITILVLRGNQGSSDRFKISSISCPLKIDPQDKNGYETVLRLPERQTAVN